MKPRCIVFYGETCSGKSTTGKLVSNIFNYPYISFGNLKRINIKYGTKIGIEIQNKLKLGLPIPAELGYLVIKDSIDTNLNFISGYPISSDEFNLLSKYTTVKGIVVLTLEEKIILERFQNRRECPKCKLPGAKGDVCPEHNIPMVLREDSTLYEFNKRRILYKDRINPFLESDTLTNMPKILINSGVMSRNEIVDKVTNWINLTIFQKGGV